MLPCNSIAILLLYIITSCLVKSIPSHFLNYSYDVKSYNVSFCYVKIVNDDSGCHFVNPQDKYVRQLVLFTSSETGKNEKPKYDLVNHILMYSFFQTNFNFTGIVFSNSSSIKELCQQHNITTVDHYQTNPYGMPIVRDLYQQASHLVRSRFYGYVNSDIIMSPNLFSLLSEVEGLVQNHTIPENFEIAGRVYDTVYTNTTDISSIDGYNQYLQHCKDNVTSLRDPNSADYFIFPNSFNFSVIADVVIGRARIDNYLMMLMLKGKGRRRRKGKSKGYLIDSTYKVTSYHLGTEGFMSKNYESQATKNKEWNEHFIEGSWMGLRQAHWKPT